MYVRGKFYENCGKVLISNQTVVIIDETVSFMSVASFYKVKPLKC